SCLAFWQRAVCRTMLNNFNIAQGMDARIKSSLALDDFNRALELAPSNAYIYYDRASLRISAGDTAAAIGDYTTAIRLEPHLAEAYYNRGLLYYEQGDNVSATRDLGKAGELGLYDAYSVMKRMK
ncbi:MAG: tetratricopeptide repeat protein, partial [Prevotella sp.]|nr:tetratricopeptide repeat protein [Prevotella sp.]